MEEPHSTSGAESANGPPFEGPEKLLELWFAPSADQVPTHVGNRPGHPTGPKFTGLRTVSHPLWHAMLDQVKCKVLSVIESEHVDAFLLSESSMFVWPHKIILKTCGTTGLLLGLDSLLKIAKEECGFSGAWRWFYSRKAFMFPAQQSAPHTSWEDETKFLDQRFVQQKPFLSLKPLQAVPPITDKLSPPLPSLSFTFLPPPHLGKPSILSFPKTPILSDLVFHFPQSVPARHPPPPHPDTHHLSSLPSHPHSHQEHHRLAPHQSVSYRSQPFPTWSAAPQPHLTRSKRRLALPQAHHVCSKKLKLHHSFFRSPQVLYPVDYSLRTTAPSAMSSRSKTIQNPKWLHTSAAAEGRPSKMRPHEAQCAGNPENWGPMPNNRRSFSPRSPMNCSPLSKVSPPAKSHLSSPPASTGGSQAAPLKAQLMAVLRMHSNLQPGEAALRLKKWVIWNSWVRGRAQMRFYPIVSPNPPNPRIMTPSPSRAASPASSSARDGWTGNEVFDDNGDLICEEEEEKPQKKAEQKSRSSRSSARQVAERAPVPATRTESPSPRKSHTIIKLKIPSRNSTPQQYPLQPTPPGLPVSPSHPQHAQKTKSPDQSVTPTATHRPLTPPPSPPN